MPSRQPFVEIFSQSPTDPSLAPPGGHVMSCFCQYFPYAVAGRSWDDGLREEVADHIVATVSEYAPNLAGAIVARQMLAPVDLAGQRGMDAEAALREAVRAHRAAIRAAEGVG